MQFDATDWDTLLTRAEMNGMIVIIDAGKVSVKPPETSGAAALKVTYGESLIELRAELDAVSQYTASAVKSVAWDSATQALITSGSASATVTEAGNVTSDTLAKVLDVKSFERVTAGFVKQEELTAWSSAELLRSKLAKTCGQVSFQGSALAKTGTMIALAGLGDRFNGNVFISGVHHSVRDGNWITTVDFGLPAGWHAQQRPAAFAGGSRAAAADPRTADRRRQADPRRPGGSISDPGHAAARPGRAPTASGPASRACTRRMASGRRSTLRLETR